MRAENPGLLSSGLVHLQAGREVLAVDAEVLALCQERCDISGFVTAAPASMRVTHRFVELPSGQLVLSLNGDVVEVSLARDLWSAEFLLRSAWYLATLRQGGLLIHSAGFAFGDQALVAVGQSGAGKSTLARLSFEGGARLLSDEMVLLLPDGPTAWGTPFRSDFQSPGRPGGLALSTLLVLKHASEERLVPVALTEAATVLMSQLFVSPHHPGVALTELQRRLLAIVDKVAVHRLSFRRDVAVGPFLKAWLEDRARR